MKAFDPQTLRESGNGLKDQMAVLRTQTQEHRSSLSITWNPLFNKCVEHEQERVPMGVTKSGVRPAVKPGPLMERISTFFHNNLVVILFD